MIERLKRPTTFLVCRDFEAGDDSYSLLEVREEFEGTSVAGFVEFHEISEQMTFQMRLIGADGETLDEAAAELVPQSLEYLAAAHILEDYSGQGGLCAVELRVNGELVSERFVRLGVQHG